MWQATEKLGHIEANIHGKLGQRFLQRIPLCQLWDLVGTLWQGRPHFSHNVFQEQGKRRWTGENSQKWDHRLGFNRAVVQNEYCQVWLFSLSASPSFWAQGRTLMSHWSRALWVSWPAISSWVVGFTSLSLNFLSWKMGVACGTLGDFEMMKGEMLKRGWDSKVLSHCCYVG